MALASTVVHDIPYLFCPCGRNHRMSRTGATVDGEPVYSSYCPGWGVRVTFVDGSPADE